MQNNEHEPHNLKRIVIPSKDITGYYPDRNGAIIDVIPRDDRWLLNPERNWGETDKTLEGRLQGFVTNLLDNKENSIKESYGVDREINTPLARLLSYTELLSECKNVTKLNQGKLESIRNAYETEKNTIYNFGKNKSKAKEYVRELYKQSYAPLINNVCEKITEERKIEDLILQKATLEIFSPNEEENITIKSLPKNIDQVKSLTEKLNEGRKSKVLASIDFFCEELSNYLLTTEDEKLFKKYKYRISKDIVANEKDVSVLAPTLTSALDPESQSPSQKTQEQISNLGTSYLVFLRNKSSKMTPALEEKYPRLSLTYDTLTSAFHSRNTKVIRDVGIRVVDEIYGDLIKGNGIKEEVSSFGNNFDISHHRLFTLVTENHNKEDLRAEQSITTETRILTAFADLSDFKHQQVEIGLIKNFKSAKDINNIIQNELRRRNNYFNINIENRSYIYKDCLMTLPFESIYFNQGITEDLYYYLSHHQYKHHDIRKYINKLEKSEKEFILNSFQNSLQKLNTPTIEKEKLFLSAYFIDYWTEDRENIKSIEHQNAGLRHEIAYNSKWFVSPRGDRFSQNRDPELNPRGISSITFKTDRNYPREHRVTIKFDKIDEQFNLWLNREGLLVGEEHSSLNFDAVYMQLFSNFILKHLYIITSAELSTEQERERDYGSLFSRLFDWKRAHYRVYAPGSVYTLASKSAIVHAREIKEDFGIDIWQVIKDRRKEGTLAENQTLTYVREVAPKDEAGNKIVRPNELAFDPEWVPHAFRVG